MKLNNTRPFEYWLKITESLSNDKLKEHVLAFFVKYGSKYYDNDASILEYLQNNDEDNSSEEDVKTLKEAIKKAMMSNESIDMTKYKVGDILPYGEMVSIKTLNIMNNTIAIDTLMPREAEKLSEILINNGFDATYKRSGNYYDMVLVNYKLPFEHGKFASLIEDTLGVIYVNSNNKRIREINKFNESVNESFHGSPDRPEVLKDEHNEIANYTGIEVKKNAKNNWAVFPKEGDNIFACDDRHGFSSSKLEYMQIEYVDHANKIISCNQDGMEVSVKFIFSDAGHRKDNDDKIAYFRIDK